MRKAIAVLPLFFAVGCASYPRGGYSGSEMLPAELRSTQKSDETLLLKANDPECVTLYIYNFDAFKKKVLKIEIESDSQEPVRFEIPYGQFSIIEDGGRSSHFDLTGGKRSAKHVYFINIFSSTPGDFLIPIANNIMDGSFMLKLRARPGKPDALIRSAGFEAAVEIGTTEKELLKKFPAPRYSSLEFANQTRLLEYYFGEYGLGYQVMLTNQKIAEIQRFFADQAPLVRTGR